MENNAVRYYEFGEFRLDARRRILFKSGNQIPLSTRICDLLLVMVQNEGQVLEHDELLDKVWEGTFVEQSNLKKCISTLRQILGEQPNESLYIKTIPRRGYSFVAPVRAIANDDDTLLLHQTDTEIIIEEEITEDDDSFIENSERKNLSGKKETLFNKIISSKILLLLAATLILGVLVLGIRFFFTKTPVNFSADNIRITKLTSDGKIYSGDVSADGNYLIYSTTDKDGLASLWIKQIAANSATRIIPPIKASFYTYLFTPDGNYIYYTLNHFEDPSQNGIYKVPALGGTPVKVMDKALISGILPDGKRMIISKNSDIGKSVIAIADIDGTNEREIANFDIEYRIWFLQISPDGNNLLLTIRRQYQDKITFRVSEIPIASSPENVSMRDIIPEQDRAIRSAKWLPDKSSLILAVRETNAELVQLWQYFPSSGEWRRITNDNNFYVGIGILRDSKAFVTTQTINLTNLWLAENGSTNFRQIGSGSTNYLAAEWMKDGRILFTNIENQKETISIMSADGSSIQQLTSGTDGVRLFPHLTSDGRYISFLSTRSGTGQIWRMDADGKNLVKVTNTDLQLYGGRVLSDGQTVIFQAYVKSKGWALLKQTPGGQIISLTDSETDSPTVSPDEKIFAAIVTDPKTRKVSLTIGSIEDGKVIKTFDIPSTAYLLKFTPDNTGLAYITLKDGVTQIFVQPLDGSPIKQITDFQTDKIIYFDWSPNGKNLLVNRDKMLNDALLIQAETEKSSK